MAEVPAPPYVGPANRHGGKGNKPINRIVIHSTVGPTKPGSARNIAHMFNTTSRAASAHYIVDAAEVLQDLYDSYVAYHAPPNSGSLGVEICDDPGPSESKPYPASRWADGDHRKAFLLAADLVGKLCKAYGLPIRKLSPSDLRAGKKGICSHIDVSHAWGQTNHWDPGKFPWDEFIRLAKKAANGEDIGAEVIDTGSSGGSTGGGSTYEEVDYGTVLGLYDKGAPVKEWQSKALKYSDKDADGFFGPSTEKDTKAWQRANGLDDDGLVGDDTWSKYKSGGFTMPKKAKVPGKKYKFPYESGGYIGPKSGPNRSHSGIGGRKTGGVLDKTHNKRWVNQLENRGWDPVGDYLTEFGNDGMYGGELEALIRAFQRDQGLPVDGLAGKSTWDAAFKNPVS